MWMKRRRSRKEGFWIHWMRSNWVRDRSMRPRLALRPSNADAPHVTKSNVLRQRMARPRQTKIEWGVVFVVGAVIAVVVAGNGRAAAEDLSQSVKVAFRGVVHIAREDVLGLNPPARRLIAQWLCRSGQHLVRGERIVVFDASEVRRAEALKRFDVEIARIQLERDNLQLATRLEEIRSEKMSLESERRVVLTALARARKPDQQKNDLLRAEYDRQRLHVGKLEREVELNRRRFELGELAEEKIVEMEHGITKAKANAEVQRLRWRKAVDDIDVHAVAKLVLQEEALSMKIGRPAGESAVPARPASGLHKRIEVLQAQLASARKKNESALDRARKEHHELDRDGWDVTPVRFLEVVPNGEETPIVRVVFQPEELHVPDGCRVDAGAPMDASREYGWDRDMRENLRAREHNDPKARGVMLVRNAATWRLSVATGLYDIRIGLGDTVDWQGCMVGHEGRTIFVERHLKEPVTVAKTVAVTDGTLSLRFGHPWGKAMVAPDDGAVRLQRWLHVGQRFRWTNWPIAYFTDPGKYKVEALVHQDVVPLLKVGAMPEEELLPDADPQIDVILGIDDMESRGIAEDEEFFDDFPTDSTTIDVDGPVTRPVATLDSVAEAKRAMASSGVTMVDAAGQIFEGVVGSIGTTAVEMTRTRPGWFGGDEKRGKDLVARKVLIDLRERDASLLHLGETVSCEMRFECGREMRVVPSHLVVEGTSRSLAVDGDGRRIELEGFRLGDSFILTNGADEVELSVPMEINIDEVTTERRLPGEIMAGKYQEVGIAESWGRIKTLIDDGSWVQKGQKIITLYNPELESQKEEIKEARIKAKQNYLVAMETRRLKTVEAEIEHNAKVVVERTARVEIMEREKVDTVLVARAEAGLGIARAEAQRETQRVAKMRAMRGASGVELRTAEIRRHRAAIRHMAAEVAHVAALRQHDWVALLGARRVGLDAADALSLRAMALQMLRKEELVSRLAAELALQRAMEGNGRQRRFERIRIVKAPSPGRLFYLTGWNDHTESRTKITKDFLVWGGMPIAQILDMSALGMEAEVPEELYDQIDMVTPVQVGFSQYPGQRIDAAIDRIGKSFFVPKELKDMRHGQQAVNTRRVFTLSVQFAPPVEMADRLTPGTKGFIYFP